MKNDTVFDYDPENDSLFIYRKSKVKGSVDVGDIIVDLSLDGKVAGLEILNASGVLKNLGVRNPKGVLGGIRCASIRAVYRPDSIMVFFSISSKSREISSSVAMPIQIAK